MSERVSGGTAGVGAAGAGPFDQVGYSRREGRQVGACSVGAFADGQPLFHTHQDVAGFLNWLCQHGSDRSFWFRDGDVSSHLYDKDHDDSHDGGDGGIDSDCVFYHSGHGFTLPGEGVFRASMGRGSTGKPTADSNDMRIGDGHCRYLFWSTCFSLRVSKGHSPLRSWSRSNQGLRMIFGFDTTTLDSPYLGEHFGRQHGCGYGFTLAWLTASWGVSDRQIPVVAACGSTRDEAVDRMNHERQFRREAVGGDWWAWCWLGKPLYERPAAPEASRPLPTVPLASADAHTVEEVAERFGFADATVRTGQDPAVLRNADRCLVVTGDGVVTAHLAQPVRGGGPLDREQAEHAARRALSACGLDPAGSLLLDRIVPIHAACAAVADPVGTRQEWSDGMLVRYRQMINGVPVVTPGAGYVDLVLDSSGVVTSLTSTTRTVADPLDQVSAAGADVDGPGRQPLPVAAVDSRRLLAGPVAERVSVLAEGDHRSAELRIVPDSAAVGYEIQKDQAVPVAHCVIEVVTEDRRRQRHRITAPVESG